MSSIKDQIITLVKQRQHSHKVALEQEKEPRSKHAIDLIARIREDSRLIEVIDSLPDECLADKRKTSDEPVTESHDLEEEIQNAIDKYPLNKEDMSEDDIATYHQGLIFGARHFAEWGAKHLK